MPTHRRPSQRSHKKFEATTQIVASLSDTFSVQNTPVPPPCANTVQPQVECLSTLVTHANAPLSLPRSVDPWKKTWRPSHERSGENIRARKMTARLPEPPQHQTPT